MYMQFQFFTNHVIVFIGRCTSFLTYKLRTRKESVGYEKNINTENNIYYELRNQYKIQNFFTIVCRCQFEIFPPQNPGPPSK